MVSNHNEVFDFGWASYAFIVFVSFWGGLVNYLHKLQEGKRDEFKFATLLSDLLISGFSGVIVFWLCMWKEVDMLPTSVAVGIAGHLGSRTIFLIEKIIEKKYGKFLTGEDAPDSEFIEDVIEDTVEELREHDFPTVPIEDFDKVVAKVKDRYKHH